MPEDRLALTAKEEMDKKLDQADSAKLEHGEEEGQQPDTISRAEYEKLQKSTQKRIDQLVAKTKTLEEELGKSKTEAPKGERDEIGSMEAQTHSLLKRIMDLETDILDAYDADKKDQVRKLRIEKFKLEEELHEIRDEYKSYLKKQEKEEISKKTQTDFQKWTESWTEAMEEFPELKGENGKLNTASKLFQAAAKILADGGRKPKFAKWLNEYNMLINPRYDRPEGPIMAVFKASRDVKENKLEQEKSNIERENKALKAKDQVIDSPEGGGPIGASKTITRKELDKLEEAAQEHGFKSTHGRLYLRALARYEGRR